MKLRFGSQNHNIHKNVIKPRNKECQIQIRDVSKSENVEDFFIAIDDKLKNMEFYPNEARILSCKIKN